MNIGSYEIYKVLYGLNLELKCNGINFVMLWNM